MDTSGVLAALDRREPSNVATVNALRDSRPPRLLSPFVLAEVDYLVSGRVGLAAVSSFLEDVSVRAYDLQPFGPADVAEALAVMKRYADLNIGLADASIVVLANRHGTTNVLTLDERHFRALRTNRGEPFRLLPADA